MRILYKCYICKKSLPDRTKMMRFGIQKYDPNKYYGQFVAYKNVDLCIHCYNKMITYMKDLRKGEME